MNTGIAWLSSCEDWSDLSLPGFRSCFLSYTPVDWPHSVLLWPFFLHIRVCWAVKGNVENKADPSLYDPTQWPSKTGCFQHVETAVSEKNSDWPDLHSNLCVISTGHCDRPGTGHMVPFQPEAPHGVGRLLFIKKVRECTKRRCKYQDTTTRGTINHTTLF